MLRLTAANTAAVSPLQIPNSGKPPELLLSEFYQHHTFHGPRLHALTNVLETGPNYAIGLARTADSDGLKGTVADVLSLDAMLQLCAYWATVHLGRIGLPIGADKVTILRRTEPGATVRIAGQLKDSAEGVFAADSLVTTGGGAKGQVVPDDWEALVKRFTGVAKTFISLGDGGQAEHVPAFAPGFA